MHNVYIRRMPDAVIRVEDALYPTWHIRFNNGDVYETRRGYGCVLYVDAMKLAMAEYRKHSTYTGEYPDWEVL